MTESNEVLSATARLLNAVSALLEKGIEGGEAATVPSLSADVPAARRGRKPKETPAAAPATPPAPATPAFDPMMDMGGAAQPAPTPSAPAAPAAMTEAESTLKAQEANKALVKAFPAVSGTPPMPEGTPPMPEGFHKAKALLAEFGVARTTDLVHAQRVAYIGKIEALIAARPA